jgi:hypothetical protein
MDAKLLTGIAVGAVLGFGIAIVSGNEYTPTPPNVTVEQIQSAYMRGWVLVRVPEGCQPTDHTSCVGGAFKRPRYMFFMGSP